MSPISCTSRANDPKLSAAVPQQCAHESEIRTDSQVMHCSCSALSGQRCVQEREERSRVAAEHARGISLLLRTVPREMLLLLRTDDCLRSLEHRLHVPLNTVATTARACTRARNTGNASVPRRTGSRILGRLAAMSDRAQLEVRLFAMSALTRWQRKRGQEGQLPSMPVR